MFGWEAFGEYTVDHTFFSSISWIHWDFFFNTIQKYTHSYWIESVSVESAVGFIHISDFIPFKISLQTISLRYERAHKSERSIVVRTRTTWNHLLFNFIWTIHFRIRQLNLVHLHFSLIYFSCKMCFWRANLMAPQSNSNFVSVCFFFSKCIQPKMNGYSVMAWCWIFYRWYWVGIYCGENISSKLVWILCAMS